MRAAVSRYLLRDEVIDICRARIQIWSDDGNAFSLKRFFEASADQTVTVRSHFANALREYATAMHPEALSPAGIFCKGETMRQRFREERSFVTKMRRDGTPRFAQQTAYNLEVTSGHEQNG